MKGSVYFGRCIFLSWYCDLGTCKFCFRSTIKHKIKHSSSAKRSVESILTDAIIGKNMGWGIEFLTGGYGIFSFDEIVDIAENVSKIYEKKIWVNLGVLNEGELRKLKPFVEGVCASIETIEKTRHDELCPDKPIEPYEEMLKVARALGLKRSITIVVGLEKSISDIELLLDFIKKHELERITFYALKPVKGSPFEKSPDAKYYAKWIRRVRECFPDIEIVAGLTPKNPEYTKYVVEAGADAITKFPVLKKFNSEETKLIEKQIEEAGKEFMGYLNTFPGISVDDEIQKLSLSNEQKERIREKVEQYARKMR